MGPRFRGDDPNKLSEMVNDLEPGITVATARRRLAQILRAHGLDTPELDARLLVAHALGLDHAGLVAQSERILATDEAGLIASFAARRLAGEPVARIRGVKEFWGLALRLNRATLVPRPETETVVEAALAIHGRDRETSTLRIADLGTGSGALLLALLSELPAAYGIGTDMSLEALGAARANAATLGLGERASFVACDYGTALRGPFDLIVCNPPYVTHDEIPSLAPEVRDFDPPAALDGGPDGLAAYRALAADARRLLAPDGHLVIELGAGQLGAVRALFVASGLVALPPRHDLAGMARALPVQSSP
jgi:release factor glutamine methyltransferase